jgi:hypothetical protein
MQTNRDQLREAADLWLDPRLQQFRRERIALEHIETSGLVDAADRVLAGQQRMLRERESEIDSAVAIELFLAGKWATAALHHVHSWKFAKERQLYHSEGKPLTVCAGSLKLGLPFETALDLVGAEPSTRAPAHGCFCVFEDSTLTNVAKKWRWWCDDCTHAHRQSRRDQKRAVKKQARIVRRQRFGAARDEAQILAEFRATTTSVTNTPEA